MGGTKLKWEGRWDQLKGKAKQVWGSLTDDELEKAGGDFDRAVGVIKERTGESIESIEGKLDDDVCHDKPQGSCH